MKSLQLILIFTLSLLLFQSCQKEEIEIDKSVLYEDTQKQENEPLEIEPSLLEEIKKYSKTLPTDKIQAQPEIDVNLEQAKSRNEEVQLSFIPPDPNKLYLECGLSYFGSTIGEYNTINNSTYRALGFSRPNLNGGDQLYAISMNQTNTVTFNLTNTRQNLAMVLYEGDYDINRRELILRRIVSWTTSSSRYSDFIGPVTLTPGNYILVIDGVPYSESDYRIEMNCAGGGGSGSQTCDDMERYYHGDLSNQSFKWEKWSSNDRDAQVTSNSYDNQYLKIAASNYNDQPDVIYKTGRETNGVHRFSMDMWIYRNRSGYINVQKRLRSEWGGQIWFYANGTGQVLINGRRLSFSYPQSKWMKVELEFDFYRNQTNLYIDGQWKRGWGIRESARSSSGSYQIEGINFYSASSSDQVFVDNVCFD